MKPSRELGGAPDSPVMDIGTLPARSVPADLRRRWARRQRARKVVFAVCILLGLLLAFLVSFTLTLYLKSPARRVPPLEVVLAMDDREAAEALKGFSAVYIIEAWGEPLSDYEMEFDRYGTCRYLLYKSPHSLDHVELFIPVDRYGVAYAEVWQVFRAYPVHIGRDGEWATVTPCPGEAETAYGDLISINLATSRPAVLDSLDPRIPVIIYYKGTPTLGDGHDLPRISTVEEMHFYDNRLEPPEEPEGDS